jgi:hypothetical protein
VGKTTEDKIQDEVRRRMTDLASSAGVDRGRIAIEVLFLLPTDFVRQYIELFDKALGDPISPATDGGRDEGRIKARGIPKDALKARSMGGAQAGGKKFVAGRWPIRSELALAAKQRLDRSISRFIEVTMADLARAGAGAPGLVENGCLECGRGFAGGWVRCPFHT